MTAKLVSKASRLSSEGTLDAAAASRLQGALAEDDDNPLFLGGIRVPPAEAITDAMGTAIATGLTVMLLTDMCSDACWPPQTNVVRLSCHVCIAIPSAIVALQPNTPCNGTCCFLHDMLRHVSSTCSHTITVRITHWGSKSCLQLHASRKCCYSSLTLSVTNLQNITEQPNNQKPTSVSPSPIQGVCKC